jgi:ribonucleoside-diphosphate reductase alpha chain
MLPRGYLTDAPPPSLENLFMLNLDATLNAITVPTNNTHSNGLTFEPHFTHGEHPYSSIIWEKRDARITAPDGTIIFEQLGVEVPSFWSQQATNIVAQKYFRGPLGSPEREYSVKQMIDRVVNTITDWGIKDNYFADSGSPFFERELKYLLVHQMACFNSPVWFNIGVPNRPQIAGACYILDVEDNLQSIFNWYTEEGTIFSAGSGTGINISKLRGEGEPLSGGGRASGPLSFMAVADKNGGVIKSGGTTRRSAKMVIMDINHPDIERFIWCKVREEEKADVLKKAGYSDSLDGDIYQTIGYQNANNSVSIPDAFMVNTNYRTTWRTDGTTANYYTTQELLHQIAEAAHRCGDPGVFFEDTANKWHTTPSAGRIVSTNPCAEFIRPPNESCNLSSFNLLKFLNEDGRFAIEDFMHAVDIMVTAMDILVGNADYPTEKIKKNSHKYRTVGLGYNNLGAVLMAKGLAYDSNEGRDLAANITALMTGRAYRQSAILAKHLGEFPGYKEDAHFMLSVIRQHMDAAENACVGEFIVALGDTWDSSYFIGKQRGFRNAQVSCLQPGGTVSLMMGCCTTGIEPEMSLIKQKKLSGGGILKQVNPMVQRALESLNYVPSIIPLYLQYLERDETLERSGLFMQHLPVFDCAFPTTPEGRSISWEAHIKMCAAVQPFLSGGISKTVNMPEDATVEDVERAYRMAWELGLKSISIYRNNCKFVQPVTNGHVKDVSKIVSMTDDPTIFVQDILNTPLVPKRRRLPDERQAITHKFSIGGHEGYVTVGMFEDGTPGEIWLVMAKEGSTVSGLCDTVATLTSLSLQYGVPLEALVNKFAYTHFEPSGFTTNAEIHQAKSIVDYVFRWLGKKFLNQPSTPLPEEMNEVAKKEMTFRVAAQQADSPICTECGNLTTRSGSCFVCMSCGTSSGCS